MSVIRQSDPDFRICRVSFDTLVALQARAEARGWSTRWSSLDALRSQVKEGDVLVQSFLREERAGGVQAVRCFVLTATTGKDHAGGVFTLDVEPGELAALDRLDRDPDVRSALMHVFTLATGMVVPLPKN